MSYEPTTWANGDIITATKLNNIESGVQSVSSSYTPTTWANGDIITATKLNNIEQGIANAGGGGGSSDFSTAEVTVVNNSADDVELIIVYIQSSPLGDSLSSFADIVAEDTQTISAVLYNGTAFTDVYGLNISVSGNADIQGAILNITGDCTITIS